jgi:UDP-N-acetylmuramoylalanine--D-glutamate ligase
VYVTGPAAEPIAATIEPTGVPVHRCASMREAVAEATEAATPGSTILLAPACASFDAYRDYEARGDHFRELVRVIEAASR